MEGKVCIKCGEWKPLDDFHKTKRRKDGRNLYCKKCMSDYKKEYRKKNSEKIKEWNKEYNKKYYAEHKEELNEKSKIWREENKEQISKNKKIWYKKNKEKISERDKQRHANWKEGHVEQIKNILDKVNPRFKELDLPVFGCIYKVENIRTGRVYIGQTVTPLKRRYKNGIIKDWIRERREKQNQKFLEEIEKEEDFEITEVLDVGCCQYHLNKLEVYYIDRYNSYKEGYNNNSGNYDTNDGLEEFINILKEHNIEFSESELIIGA